MPTRDPLRLLELLLLVLGQRSAIEHAELLERDDLARPIGRAGSGPRSETISMHGSVSSVLTNCRKRLRFSGSRTTAAHSH